MRRAKTKIRCLDMSYEDVVQIQAREVLRQVLIVAKERYKRARAGLKCRYASVTRRPSVNHWQRIRRLERYVEHRCSESIMIIVDQLRALGSEHSSVLFYTPAFSTEAHGYPDDREEAARAVYPEFVCSCGEDATHECLERGCAPGGCQHCCDQPGCAVWTDWNAEDPPKNEDDDQDYDDPPEDRYE